MVKQYLLCILAISAFAGFVSSQTCTGPLQELVECANPCDPTCDEPNRPPCPTFACSPGCACQEGAILSSSAVGATCIPKTACPRPKPITCPRGEVLGKCGNPCQPSCQFPKKEPCPTFACTPGCFCPPGFIRLNDDPLSKCIRVTNFRCRLINYFQRFQGTQQAQAVRG